MLGVKYIEKEGLLGVYEAGFYYFSFQICVTTSDWKNASLWAQKSFEANATAMGEKHSLQYKNYVANPRSHPAASMKQRATLTGPP